MSVSVMDILTEPWMTLSIYLGGVKVNLLVGLTPEDAGLIGKSLWFN